MSHYIDTLDTLPGYIFIKDQNSRFLWINSEMRKELLGGISINKVEQRLDEEMPWGELSELYVRDDQKALHGEVILTLEPCISNTGSIITMMTKKTLYATEYFESNCVLAQATHVENNNIENFVYDYIKTNSQNNLKSVQIIDKYKISSSNLILSIRESECLYYFLRGKTAKSIARILEISAKTVEYHINNIKEKMGCYSKEQLIEKCFVDEIVKFIPSSIFNKVLINEDLG